MSILTYTKKFMKVKLIRVSTIPMSLNYLLKGQLHFLSKRFNVLAVSSPGKDLELIKQREKIDVKSIPIKRNISILNDIKSLIKMYLLFKKEKPQIVHSITPKAGLISMIAAYFARVPIRMHTFTGLIFPTKKGGFQKLLIVMDKILCYCATNVYPEGKGVKKDLVNFRITKKELKIIANGNVNGIDLNYFTPTTVSLDEKSNLSNNLGIIKTDFVFIFVGRLVGDKGINELVTVFDKINKTHQDLKLLLVGSMEKKLDPLNKETIRIIEENKNILAVGFQYDVRPYLAIANALVFPSYREGFPNVVMQAGAMELPSIVTNINGSNEIIANNQNGIIIEPKKENELLNAMEQMYTDKNLFKKLKSKSRFMIENRYNQQFVWSSLLNEYEELLSQKNKICYIKEV